MEANRKTVLYPWIYFLQNSRSLAITINLQPQTKHLNNRC